MKRRRTIFVAGGLLLALAIGSWLAFTRSAFPPDGLLLLLPDGTSFSDSKVMLWLDAGSEEVSILFRFMTPNSLAPSSPGPDAPG